MGLLIIYSMQLGEGVGGSLTQWHKAKGLQVLQILKFPKMALYFSLVNFIQKKLSKKKLSANKPYSKFYPKKVIQI